MRRRTLAVVSGVVVVIAAAWVASAPPPHLVPAAPFDVGPVPLSVVQARADSGDQLAKAARRSDAALPGHDDIVLQEHHGRAFATAMDGWIWRIDLASGAASRFVQAPMSPAGARQVPGDDDRILFCATRLDDNTYPNTVSPGIYELTVSTRRIVPVALRVPKLAPQPPSPAVPNGGMVFTPQTLPAVAMRTLDAGNSRAIAFCNDIDVSRDGRRIYMSEPFDYPGASSGTGSVAEAITLATNGRLWMFDLEAGTVRLVAQGYHFIDGVLLEPGAEGEDSVLVTETPKYRILRLHLQGAKAGHGEVVIDNLPGLPDGLDRDARGRIWAGLIKERTPLATWIHAHPWIKPLLLRLPQWALPITRPTAVMTLSPDASKVLYYSHHDGSVVRDIAVVVPGRDRIYLPSFDRKAHGLVSMPYPPGLEP